MDLRIAGTMLLKVPVEWFSSGCIRSMSALQKVVDAYILKVAPHLRFITTTAACV